MNKKISYALIALALVIVLSIGLVSCQDDEPIEVRGVTNLDSLHLKDTGATATPVLIADQEGTGAIMVLKDAGTPVYSVYDGGAVAQSGAYGLTGDLTMTGDIGLTGGLTLSGLLLSSFANLTATEGLVITPTVTTYALDTSGAVTITLAAAGTEGQLLILINDDANATIIADTNIRTSDGNAITLAGAHDIAAFIYQDAEWLELLTIANS